MRNLGQPLPGHLGLLSWSTSNKAYFGQETSLLRNKICQKVSKKLQPGTKMQFSKLDVNSLEDPPQTTFWGMSCLCLDFKRPSSSPARISFAKKIATRNQNNNFLISWGTAWKSEDLG